MVTVTPGGWTGFISTIQTEDTISPYAPNPDLKRYKGKGWYEGGPKNSGFPLLIKCPLCKKTIKTGEIAYAYNNPLPTGNVIVQHKECLEEILEDSPYTKLEKIKARVEAGGDFFE